MNHKLHAHNPHQQTGEWVDDKPHIESEKEVLGQQREHEPQKEAQEDQDEDGKQDFVRLLFGSIAAVFFFLVLFQDVLGVVSFS